MFRMFLIRVVFVVVYHTVYEGDFTLPCFQMSMTLVGRKPYKAGCMHFSHEHRVYVGASITPLLST